MRLLQSFTTSTVHLRPKFRTHRLRPHNVLSSDCCGPRQFRRRAVSSILSNGAFAGLDSISSKTCEVNFFITIQLVSPFIAQALRQAAPPETSSNCRGSHEHHVSSQRGAPHGRIPKPLQFQYWRICTGCKRSYLTAHRSIRKKLLRFPDSKSQRPPDESENPISLLIGGGRANCDGKQNIPVVPLHRTDSIPIEVQIDSDPDSDAEDYEGRKTSREDDGNDGNKMRGSGIISYRNNGSNT